jgi:hypothetical protein
MNPIACIQGVQAAIDAGVGHLSIETDAAAMVQAVYPSSHNFSAATHLITELRNLLVQNFISWSVHFCPRSCNRVGHELACLGSVSDPEEEPNLVSILAHVISLIAEDSASSQ